MLLNKTDELLVELEKLNNLKELANDSQGFFKRSQELKSIDNLLSTIVDIVVLFRKQGFEIDIETIFDNFIKSGIEYFFSSLPLIVYSSTLLVLIPARRFSMFSMLVS